VTRLLLTGATGFIGSHAVTCAITRGFDVHALCRRMPERPHRGVTYHALDLLERRDLASCVRAIGATHLLHPAWCVTPGTFWNTRENYRWVSATLDLAAAFVEGGGTRIVGVGTGFEYVASDAPCHEERTELCPSSAYAVSKDATRRLLARLAATDGVSFAWGRVFHLYGPGEHPSRLVASVSRSLLRQEPALCSEGTYIRDFLHVHDTADGLVALTASGVEGPVNIASGVPVAIRDVVSEVAVQIGTAELVRFGALPARPEPPRQVADVSRLRREVGWSPRFDLSSGIADTIAWHRQQETLGGVQTS
jgi:nucleoside-diphosphate-sugar epimerase